MYFFVQLCTFFSARVHLMSMNQNNWKSGASCERTRAAFDACAEVLSGVARRKLWAQASKMKYMRKYIFFLFVLPVWQLALNTSPTFFPFLLLPFLIPIHFRHFLPYRQSYPPPWECDHSHSLLCGIAFARGHRETAENLCRYSRPFNRVCPQSNSLWKMTSRSAFRCAGRGPAVTHPSTNPAKSFFFFFLNMFIFFIQVWY